MSVAFFLRCVVLYRNCTVLCCNELWLCVRVSVCRLSPAPGSRRRTSEQIERATESRK